MKIIVHEDAVSLGRDAGHQAADWIREVIREKGEANIILATGASQFETLLQLTKEKVDWEKVMMFHLDEYIGLQESAPPGFRQYLRERFIQKIDRLKMVYFIRGEADPTEECRRLGGIIQNITIDVALLGIGENGHLGFNDPPADFETEQPFIVVNLDERCRQQQLGEGWFQRLEEVPLRAITMSVHQIMKSNRIICSVPDARKAEAVKSCLENSVSNLFPASILQNHPHCICFLDKLSAAFLEKKS